MGIPKEGIVVVNKPAGITSHDVVDQVRRLTGVKRVGHAGTLDPFATGVLVVMIGRQATKRSNKLMNVVKEYLATIEFGRTTDTLDPTGNFTGKPIAVKLDRPKLESVLQSFVGDYEQEVPRYAAVKLKGEKLYQMARQGKEFKTPVKKVTIQAIELLQGPAGKSNQVGKNSFPQVQIKVTCSSGTYIRALARDIGAKLGVPAYLVSLCRIRQGQFSLDQAISLSRKSFH